MTETTEQPHLRRAMGLLPVIGFPLAPFNLAAGPAFVSSLGLLPVILLACAASGEAICCSLSSPITSPSRARSTRSRP